MCNGYYNFPWVDMWFEHYNYNYRISIVGYGRVTLNMLYDVFVLERHFAFFYTLYLNLLYFIQWNLWSFFFFLCVWMSTLCIFFFQILILIFLIFLCTLMWVVNKERDEKYWGCLRKIFVYLKYVSNE